MRETDILSAKQLVETFLKNNGTDYIYAELKLEDQDPIPENTQTSNPFSPSSNNSYGNLKTFRTWGIYVNWSVKTLTLHGPDSNDWKKAIKNPTSIPNIFHSKNTGFWIGPFPSFEMAYTFSELMKKALYLKTHEETLISSSRGIINQPIKLF